MENGINLKDGFIKQNMVFMSGMLIAPVVACVCTLSRAAVICFVFSFITPLAVIACRFIPRTIVYTLRVILYSVAAAVFYIPAVFMAQAFFGTELVSSVGVYLPILVTNSLILSKTETRFYHEPLKKMIPDVIVFIIGFDVSCIVTGFLRGMLAFGRVLEIDFRLPFTIPALETTFGGFIFVGIGAGLFRAVYNHRKAAAEKPQEEEETLAELAEDMGEFLTGHGKHEKIKIYKAAAKKPKAENGLLEMEFLSNRDILAEFEAIVAEGVEIMPDEPAAELPAEDEAADAAAEDISAEETEASASDDGKDGEE